MISLVLPAYNPGAAVAQTWQAVRDFLKQQPDAWDVLFVCDGCTDETLSILDRLTLTQPHRRIRVLSYPKNRGKGYALRTGLMAAKGRLRIFTDVDLAYSFTDILRVAAELRAGAAVAIASREHPQSLIQLPPAYLGYVYRRRLQSTVFSAATRWMLPIRHADTQAGLKGMRADVAQTLLPLMHCDGFGFDCELLTACARYNIPVREVPVCVQYHSDASSTGGIRTIWRMLRELQLVRRKWPRKDYPALAEPTNTLASPSLTRAA